MGEPLSPAIPPVVEAEGRSAVVDRAIDALDDGRIDEAVNRLRRFLADDTQVLSAFSILGWSAWKQNQTEQAVALWKLLRKVTAALPLAENVLAKGYIPEKEIAGFAEYYNRVFVAGQAPEKAQEQISAGVAKRAQEDLVRQGNMGAALSAAVTDLQDGRVDRATDRVRQFLATDPVLLRAFGALGWAYWRVNMKDDAVFLWQELRKLATGNGIERQVLVSGYIPVGNTEAVTDYYSRSLGLEPAEVRNAILRPPAAEDAAAAPVASALPRGANRGLTLDSAQAAVDVGAVIPDAGARRTLDPVAGEATGLAAADELREYIRTRKAGAAKPRGSEPLAANLASEPRPKAAYLKPVAQGPAPGSAPRASESLSSWGAPPPSSPAMAVSTAAVAPTVAPASDKAWDSALADLQVARYDRAVPKLRRVVEKDPANMRAWSALGWAYWMQGRKDDALAVWHDFKQLGTEEDIGLSSLSRCYMPAEENIDQAADYYAWCLNLNQEDVRRKLGRGAAGKPLAYQAASLTGQLKNMVDENPERLELRVAYAQALAKEGRLEESLAQWHIIRRQDAANLDYAAQEQAVQLQVAPYAADAVATAPPLVASTEPVAAEVNLKPPIRVDSPVTLESEVRPTIQTRASYRQNTDTDDTVIPRPTLIQKRDDGYYTSGTYAGDWDYYRRKYVPEEEMPALVDAIADLDAARFSDAAGRLERLLLRYPSRLKVRGALGWAYWNMGRKEDAMALWEDYRQAGSTRRLDYADLRDAYVPRNDPDKAALYYSRTWALDADEVRRRIIAPVAKTTEVPPPISKPQTGGEVVRLRALVEKSPADVELRADYAKALMAAGMYDAALEQWTYVRKMDPDNGDYVTYETETLRHAGSRVALPPEQKERSVRTIKAPSSALTYTRPVAPVPLPQLVLPPAERKPVEPRGFYKRYGIYGPYYNAAEQKPTLIREPAPPVKRPVPQQQQYYEYNPYQRDRRADANVRQPLPPPLPDARSQAAAPDASQYYNPYGVYSAAPRPDALAPRTTAPTAPPTAEPGRPVYRDTYGQNYPYMADRGPAVDYRRDQLPPPVAPARPVYRDTYEQNSPATTYRSPPVDYRREPPPPQPPLPPPQPPPVDARQTAPDRIYDPYYDQRGNADPTRGAPPPPQSQPRSATQGYTQGYYLQYTDASPYEDTVARPAPVSDSSAGTGSPLVLFPPVSVEASTNVGGELVAVPAPDSPDGTGSSWVVTTASPAPAPTNEGGEPVAVPALPDSFGGKGPSWAATIPMPAQTATSDGGERAPKTENLLSQAIDDLDVGEVEEALPKLEKVVEEEPLKLKGWTALGWAYWKLGRRDDAIGLYRKLRAVAPTMRLDSSVLDNGYINRGNMEETIKYYGECLGLDEDALRTQYSRKQMGRLAGKVGLTVERLREMVAENPHWIDLRVELVKKLMSAQAYDEALEQWDVIRQVYPDTVEYMENQIECLFYSGRRQEAIDLCQRTLERDNCNLRALDFWAGATEASSTPEDALVPLRRMAACAAERDKRVGAKNRIVDLCVTLWRKDPARYRLDEPIALLGEIMKEDEFDSNAYLTRGELMLAQKNIKAAMQDFNYVLTSLNPNSLRARDGLYQCYAGDKQYAAAAKQLEMKAAFNPTNPYALYDQAKVEASRGNYAKAEKLLDQMEAMGRNGAVGVLLYHGLSELPDTSVLPVARFREHLEALRQAGFTFVPPADLPNILNRKAPAAQASGNTARSAAGGSANDTAAGFGKTPRLVTVTFDDARRDAMTLASQVALDYGTRFGMFVPMGPILDKINFSADWDMLRYFAPSWDYGSHAVYISYFEPLDTKGNRGRPVSNRVWRTDENRPETRTEYLQRIRTEYEGSRRMLEENLGDLQSGVSMIAYPFGDIGQEASSNVVDAIMVNLREASSNFSMGFIQSRYGFAVSGDNPLLYQRWEPGRDDTGQEVVLHILQSHPVTMARRMKVEMATDQGKLRKAETLIKQLEDDDLPPEILNVTKEYLQTRLSRYYVENPRVKDAPLPPRVMGLIRPYAEANLAYTSNSLSDREWRMGLLGGGKLTPGWSAEGRAGVGRYTSKAKSGNLGTRQYPRLNVSAADVGAMLKYAFENGNSVAGDVTQRKFGRPANTSVMGYGLEGAYAPSLPLEFKARYEHDSVLTARAISDGTTYNSVTAEANYRKTDRWDLNGLVGSTTFSDDNSRTNLTARSSYLVNENMGLYVGPRYDYIASKEKREAYWTPNQLHRILGEALIRKDYGKIHYEIGGNLGVGTSQPWDDEKGSSLAPAFSVKASIRAPLSEHWSAMSGISYLNAPSYQEWRWTGGLRLQF